MLMRIGAIVIGAIVGFVVVFGVESLGHRIYPPPADVDFNDAGQLASYVETLPTGALLFPFSAWLLGAFTGGLVACAVAREAALRNAGLVGGLVLAATIMNLVALPHPLWMIVLAPPGILLAAWYAGRLGRRFER